MIRPIRFLWAAFLLGCVGARAEDSAKIPEKEIRQWVAQLGSDRLETRDGAADRIRTLLLDAEKRKDLESLRGQLRLILGLRRETVDAEVQNQLTGLLSPYLRGGVLWAKAAGELPGPVSLLELHEGRIVALGVDPQGQGWFQAYDPETGEESFRKGFLPLPGGVMGSVLEGKRLWMTGKVPQGVWAGMIDLEQGTLVWSTEPGSIPRGEVPMVVRRGNRLAVMGGLDKHDDSYWIRGYDAVEGKLLWERKPGELPGYIAGARGDVKGIVVVGRKGTSKGWIECYDPDSGKTIRRVDQEALPGRAVVAAPAGKNMLMGGTDERKVGWLGEYDLETGKAVWEQKNLQGAPLGFVVKDGAVIPWGASIDPTGNGPMMQAWLAYHDEGRGGLAWEKVIGKFPGCPLFVKGGAKEAWIGGVNLQMQGCLGILNMATQGFSFFKAPGDLPGSISSITLFKDSFVAGGVRLGDKPAGWIQRFRIEGVVAE